MYISRLFLFDDTDYDKIEKKYSILTRVEVKEYYAGDVILSEATKKKGLFIIKSGKARINSGSTSHRAVLRHLKSGDSFGAASLFDGGEIFGTEVVSVTDTSVICLPSTLVADIVRGEPVCAMNYISYLSNRVSFLNKKISAFAAGNAEQKLAVYLSGLEYTESATTLDVSYTSLASMLGIGRASLYRALDLFENEGIISRTGKTIVLTDGNALYQYI